jgi:hypothetical protein
MTPAEISLIVQLLELIIQDEPMLAADLQKLFASGTPTAADFAALRASISAETYGQFVPASDLPPGQTGS